MNLLDKASIILTPSAYNNGEALCVKPSDGSGDFDFSRNSAATRVNAQGLVEDVQILSSNLVQNGDFSNGSTDWTLQTGWSIGDDKAVVTNAPNLYQRLTQPSLSFNLNSTYKISITCSEYSSGFVYLRKPRGAEPDTSLKIDSVGTFVFTLNALTELTEFALAIGALGTDLSITNISAIEITNDTNLPRINYEGFSYDGSGNIISGSGCGSWLWEPQSTQLLPYSEDFSQWIAGGSTTIESGYLAPDGTNNAYKVSGAGSALTLPASLSTTTTRSIYARTTSGTGQANLCSFNSNTNNLFTITEQWQRFDVNSAIATGVTSFYAVDFRGGTNLSEIILWGANATNDQDYVTSYVPSNGTSVTRNQDVCTNGGSVSTISSTSGVLYAEIAALSLGASASLGLNDGSGANRVLILLQGNGDIRGFIASNSAIVFDEIYSGISTLNNNKIAISYKLNQFTLWINGVKRFTDTIGNTPIGLNQLDFNNGSGATDFYGKTKCLAVWKEVLSDENLAELTTI